MLRDLYRKRALDRLEQLSGLIGCTPLLKLHLLLDAKPLVVYAKAEQYNLTGSIKDRMALHVLREAIKKEDLKPGDTIAEATSGNTGISFAAIGGALGHPVQIFLPAWMSEERKSLLRFYGADLHLVSEKQGGFLGSIELAEKLACAQERVFLPRQFSNPDNSCAHALTTAPEIVRQLALEGQEPGIFVAGVGTGGTVMGIKQALGKAFPALQIHPLEPANSPTLSTGHKVGSHRIQGISDDFVPDLLDLSGLSSIVSVEDGDAIWMAQKLAKKGLGVGISSGANLIGAVRAQCLSPTAGATVTIFCDDSKKYLSTDLVKTEPKKADYLAGRIEIEGYEVLPCPKEKKQDSKINI